MPLLLLFTGIGLLLASFVLTEWRVGHLDAALRERLLAQVTHLAQTLDTDRLATLRFAAEDADLPFFHELSAQLASVAALSGYRGIWTVAPRDGRYRFGPESYPPDDLMYSAPGTAYRQPPLELARVFVTRQALTTPVYQDEFGRFVTAIAPIPRLDGEIFMAIGLDIPADTWRALRYRARVMPLLAGLLLCGLFVVFSRLLRWRQTQTRIDPRRLRHLETALVAATGLILTLDVTVMSNRIERREFNRVFDRLAGMHFQNIRTVWRNINESTRAAPDAGQARAVLAIACGRQPREAGLIRIGIFALNGASPSPALATHPADDAHAGGAPPWGQTRELLDPDQPRVLLPLFLPDGHAYILLASASPEFQTAHPRRLTWMTAVIGLLMSFIATAFVAMLRNSQTQLEQTVRERTARLQRHEANLSAIANAARDAIIMMGSDGSVSYWNPAAERILGYTKEEVLGQNLHALIARPSQQALHRERLSEFQRTGQGTAIGHTIELEAVRRDGVVIASELSLSSLQIDGEWYAVGILRDIEDRKRAERRLLRLNECLAGLGPDYQDNIERIVAVCGELLAGDCALYNRLRDGRLVTLGAWNVPPEFPREDCPDGHVCYDLIRGQSIAMDAAAAAAADRDDLLCIAQLAATRYYETDPQLRKYGLQAYVGHLVHSAGQPVGSLCVLFRHTFVPTDEERRLLGILAAALSAEEKRSLALHQLAQSEADLRRAKEQAERASQAKSEFLSSMSHELRTPMNAVLGFAQLLDCDPGLSVEQRENVHEILAGGQHLLELINDVLDLAQVESGRIRLRIETVPVAEVFDESLALIAPMASGQDIRIEREDPGGLRARCDRGRFKQILLNLLSNAIKYNRPRGWIRVSADRVDHPPRIRIRIEDSGIGIDPELLDTMFEPFTRLHDESTLTVEGNGIGLAVTRRLLAFMDGEIGAESHPGVGSTFWFTLPLAERHADPAPAASQPAPAMAPETAPAPRTLLHIDDQPANLRLVAGVLTQRPWIRVLSASHPRLGLELAVAHRPDLILLDLHMPGLDGYATLALLRQQSATARIPVVALTAQATAADHARGAGAGFAAYLTKPLDMVAFLQTIDRLLNPTPESDPR